MQKEETKGHRRTGWTLNPQTGFALADVMIRAEQTDSAAASGSACSTSLGVGGCRQSAAPLLLTEAFQGIPDI